MSHEAEMAAKWKMFEDYKELRSRLTTLEREANTLGVRLNTLCQILTGSPARVKILRDKVVSFPTLHDQSWVEVDLSKFDGAQIFKLLSDIESAARSRNDLGGKLRELGMSID